MPRLLDNKGITAYTKEDQDSWLEKLQLIIPFIQTFNPTLASFIVAANSIEDESFTIAGLTTEMAIIATPTISIDAGLIMSHAWVSAANTLKIRFQNTTGSNITESAGVWIIIGIKK